MNEYNDNRRPEDIESDIERTRADMSSTIDAIQNKLTPGQMIDQAVSYARTSLPADFGANLGNTIRDNPVPVALIGIGVAWLMTSGRHADGQARARRQALVHEGAYGTDLSSAAETGPHEGAMHRVASKAGEIGQRISETTSALTSRARDVTRSARERMAGSAEGVQSRAGQIGQKSQQQYYRTKDRFGQMADEQPLMLGALGLAVGTILGTLLPSTRREDELMGHKRDELLESTKQVAREQAEHVKESAKRVAQTAEEEVKRAGSEMSRTRGNGNANQPSPLDSAMTGSASGQQRPH